MCIRLISRGYGFRARAMPTSVVGKRRPVFKEVAVYACDSLIAFSEADYAAQNVTKYQELPTQSDQPI